MHNASTRTTVKIPFFNEDFVNITDKMGLKWIKAMLYMLDAK